MDLINLFSWKCYKYAPESFKLYFQGEEVNLKRKFKNKLGKLATEEKTKEIENEIKRWIRNESIFSPKTNKKKIAIISEGRPYSFVCSNRYNQYNIEEKLEQYKALKQHLAENNWKLPKVEKAKLNGKYEIDEEKTEYETIHLQGVRMI